MIMLSAEYVHGFGLFRAIPFIHGLGFFVPDLPFDFWEGIELRFGDGVVSSEEMLIGNPHTSMNERKQSTPLTTCP